MSLWLVDNTLTDEGKDAFCEAFTTRIVELVPSFDPSAEGESPYPWGAPWLWTEPEKYLPEGMSAEEAGQRWAEKCAPEIAKAVAEEQEAIKEVE
jgi:hypothetical protein